MGARRRGLAEGQLDRAPAPAPEPPLARLLLAHGAHAARLGERPDRQAHPRPRERPPPAMGGVAARRGRGGPVPRLHDQAPRGHEPSHSGRPRRGRRVAIRRHRSAPVRGRIARERLHGHPQRRRLPRGRRQRLRERLLRGLRRIPEADPGDSRQPRLVRRPRRVHVPLLRGRGAAAHVVPQLELRHPGAGGAQALALVGATRARSSPRPPLRARRRVGAAAARPVLGARHGRRAAGRDRHGHQGDARPRAGRVAAARVEGRHAQGAAHGQAALGRRRAAEDADRVGRGRGAAHNRHGRRRCGGPPRRAPLRGLHRRRRAQLPARDDSASTTSGASSTWSPAGAART
jgi:hypothetical protein